MAFYELTLESTYFGQICLNRWTYQGEGTGGAVIGSFALMSAFGLIPNPSGSDNYPSGTVFAQIMANTSLQVTYTQATVINVYDDTDFYETPITAGVTGVLMGEAVSPTSAYGFKSSRARRDVGRAYKRFVGVTEAFQDAGGAIPSGFLAGGLTDLANAMGDTLEYDDEGSTYSFVPIVMGKQRYDPETHEPSDTGSAYRYFPTPEAQALHTAVGVTWSPYATVRTQNSRQYGRGR